MSGARSASGLMCSHGSELDTRIPRAKMPKTALPPELRRKMGLQPRRSDESKENAGEIWQAGSGVLRRVGSGRDGSFLKRGSGVPMSQRASKFAQMTGKSESLRQRAHVARPSLQNSTNDQMVVTRRPRQRPRVTEEYY